MDERAGCGRCAMASRHRAEKLKKEKKKKLSQKELFFFFRFFFFLKKKFLQHQTSTKNNNLTDEVLKYPVLSADSCTWSPSGLTGVVRCTEYAGKSSFWLVDFENLASENEKKKAVGKSHKKKTKILANKTRQTYGERGSAS